MKIIQINCVYGHGSTGTLVRSIHRHLQKSGMESLVICGRKGNREPGVRKLCPEWYAKANHLLSALRGIPYGGCLLSTWALIRRIQKERPDKVHLQCINGYFVNQYRLLTWLKKKKIPTILTLHAEFSYTANCAHAYDCEKWKIGCGNCPRWRYAPHSLFFDRTARSYRRMDKALQGFEGNLTVVSVSSWLGNRAAQSPLLAQMDHRVILNGVDTEYFFCRPEISREKILLHVTACFSDDPAHPKGGYHLLALARRMHGSGFRFLVAGKYKITGEIPENVTLLGEIREPEQLSQLYCRSAATVLTSRAESFSLVCAESLCCGTPVAGFRAGAPEEIALPEFSRFVPWGNTADLAEAVKELVDNPNTDHTEISRLAQQRYAQEEMLQQYLQLYQEE